MPQLGVMQRDRRYGSLLPKHSEGRKVREMVYNKTECKKFVWAIAMANERYVF